MNTPVMEQAPAASIDSRIETALFGPKKQPQQAPPQQQPRQPQPEMHEEPEGEAPTPEQDADAPEGNAPQSAEELFEIEVDGETFALPKKLEKAVLQERDYTQKTQTLAEQRKQFELLHEQARIANFRQEFEAEVATELSQLQAYDSVLKQPVDWSSMTTDEAFRRKLQLDQWRDEREAIAKTLQGKHQQYERRVQESLGELKKKAQETISKRIPNWSEATQKALREHALADGYTEAELNQIIDPRHTLTLWKAQQFDQLKAKASKTVADVRTVKSTASNPMPQHVKEKLAFHKTLKTTAENSPQRKRAVESHVASIFNKR
jgi:hypothetical protein